MVQVVAKLCLQFRCVWHGSDVVQYWLRCGKLCVRGMVQRCGKVCVVSVCQVVVQVCVTWFRGGSVVRGMVQLWFKCVCVV